MSEQVEDRSFLVVDLEDLGNEFNKQPGLTELWGRRLANAKKAAKEAKNEFKLVCAEIELRIRRNPADYLVGRATDAAVEAAIIMQEDYQQAQTLMDKADHRVDLTQAVVYALMDRKEDIKGNIELFCTEFRQRIQISKDDTQLMGEVQKEKTRERTRHALNDE